MILLDTHIWIYLVQGDPALPADERELIAAEQARGAADAGLGVSLFSCWEVAMLVKKRRLTLPFRPEVWVAKAASYPSLELLDLTPQILVESVALPMEFHKDPADRIIVATALHHDIPILTHDRLIHANTGVTVLGAPR
jgi:PIN domain nuclease of toxin-antitoxin system